MGLKVAIHKDFRTNEKSLIMVDDKNPSIDKSFPVIEDLSNLCVLMENKEVKELAIFLAENYL